jgi:O-antigen/teichoic acid export membrane protein
VKDELQKLIRHAAVYGFGRIIGRAGSFFLIPVYTHYFSASDYGAMEILSLAAMVAGILLALGLPTSLMRFYYANDDPQERGRTVSTVLLFSIALGGSIAGLVILNASTISRMLLGSEGQAVLVRLVAVTFFFSYFSDLAWVYLRAKQRSGLYVFLTQASLIGAIILNLYFVAVRKIGVVGAFWGNAIATATVGMVLLFLTLREVGLRFSPSRLGTMLRFGAPLTLIWVAAFALNYSDRFFLQRFTGLAEVGVYALAYKFGYVLSLMVIQPFQLIWEPQSYEIAKRDNAKEIFPRLFVLYSIALTTVAFLVALLIREVFEVFVNARFQFGARMVPLIVYAYVVQGMGLFFEAGLLIRNKSRTIAAIGVVSTVFCLACNAVLIFALGAWGACLSTLISFGVLSAATYFYSQRCYPFHCDFRGIGKVIALSVLVLFAAWMLPVESLAPRVLCKLVLAAVFLFGVFKLRVLQPEEASALKELVQAGCRKIGWSSLGVAVPRN